MTPLSIATAASGFLITNTADEYVVLDENCTIIHRSLTLEGAILWSADESARRKGLASPPASPDSSGATPLPDPQQPGE